MGNLRPLKAKAAIYVLVLSVLLSGCALAKLPGQLLEVVGKVVTTTGKVVETAGKAVETGGKAIEAGGKVAETAIKTPGATEALTP